MRVRRRAVPSGAALAIRRGVPSHALLVLDSPAEAATLASILARQGLDTSSVSRGAEAIRALSRDARPDIVVMDSALRDMDGVQALRALKDRAEEEFLPVVLLSSQPDAESRVSGLLAGADDVLSKPCQGAELWARIAALLRIKAAQDSLRKAKLELERLSITDGLTGLFNRRYFQYRLEQEVERCRRHGDTVALMLIDLDHFKKVNDRYGHPAGDAVLRAAAEILTRELRRVDVCTRWGGEEFAVILPDTGRPGAAVVADRVLRALRAGLRFSAAPVRGQALRPERFRVTASLGLAVHPSAGVDRADELVSAADAALYRAKDQGRNRACFGPPPGRSPVAPAARLARAADA
jgi:two-component system cell cycle response regulator